VTNKEFALQDRVFRKACEIASKGLPRYLEIKPTRRQASKWRNRKGIANIYRGTATSWEKRYGV
jgi:hypothetical protein